MTALLLLLQQQVEIQHDAGSTVLEVEEDQTILEAALDSGLELSHDCKMGVCMTCPAKLVRRRMRCAALTLQPQRRRSSHSFRSVAAVWRMLHAKAVLRIVTERLRSRVKMLTGHGS